VNETGILLKRLVDLRMGEKRILKTKRDIVYILTSPRISNFNTGIGLFIGVTSDTAAVSLVSFDRGTAAVPVAQIELQALN